MGPRKPGQFYLGDQIWLHTEGHPRTVFWKIWDASQMNQRCKSVKKTETIQETAGGLMRPKEGVVWDGGHGVETTMKGPFAMRKSSGCFLETVMSHWEGPQPCRYFSSFYCWKLLHGGTTWSELPFQKIPLPKLAFPVSLAQLWPYSGIFPKVSTALSLKIVSLSLGAHNFTAQYFRRNYTWFHSLGLVLSPDCTSSAFCVHSFVSQITSHGRSHPVPGGDEGHLMDVELKFCSSQHLPCLGRNPISSTVKWHNNSIYLIRLFWEFS